MAHFYGLIALCLVLASASVHAVIPQVPRWFVQSGNASTPDSYGDTAALACQDFIARSNARDNPSYVYAYTGVQMLSTTTGNCLYTETAFGSTQNRTKGVSQDGTICPANSVVVSGGCQCVSPYVENSARTACVEPPDPCLALKGQSAGDWWRDTGDDNGLPAKIGFSVCDKYQPAGDGLCVATVPSTGGLCMQTEGGWWRCTGQAFYTGSKAADPTKCSPTGPGGSGDSPTDPLPSTPPSGNPPVAPSQPDPNTAAPAPCPAGQAPGTFNGTRMCQPTGGDRPQTSAAPGTGSSTTNNSDGSSTTSTTSGTTKCAEGKCTTSTVNTNVTINAPGNESCPAGQTSGTTTVNGQTRTTCTGTSGGTTSQAQSEFCKTNPTDKQCGGDGGKTGFGGSCAGGWKAISDDAVINAMAEETYRQNCKVNPDEASQTVGREEAAKTGNQTGSNPNNSAVTIGPGSFDNSDALGASATCIGDKSIVVMGKSIVIAFSMICQYLEALGLVMVGVSSLLAARIVTRG